ncbi:MAG: 50S ribosomal protein L4, partial [Verrucomicrobiota bacterium]
MKAQLLTLELAKKASIEIIESGKGTQAVHDVVVAMRANRRSGTACVKTKATVNLSGKKPWKQKGTGRARAGYASSPVWVGGGVSHGPHPRSYAKNTTKGVKKLAFRKAFSARVLADD